MVPDVSQTIGSDMRLVGERVYLRPLEESDINDDYVAWLNDPEVTRYMAVGESVTTRETLHAYLERFQNSTTDFIFAIIDRGTNQHIGNVTIHLHAVHRMADTGIMIGRKEFWGKGYGFEAWRLVIDYAFSRLGVHKLIAGAVVGNAASIATLRKLGFQQEDLLRQKFLMDGQYRDVIRFGLLREEFERACMSRPLKVGSSGGSP